MHAQTIASQEPTQVPAPLASETVVLAAPCSFTGSAQRIWPLALTGREPHWLIATGVILLIALAWVGIICWYAFWGIMLVPYRIYRRGQRRNERDALRHREMLDSQLEALERRREHHREMLEVRKPEDA